MSNFRLLCAGGIGVLGGIYLDRQRIKFKTQNVKLNSEESSSFRRSVPCLPLFGTVSAATPIPSSISTMPSVPSSLTVPEKPISTVPGPSRVSEIMRFGFPGMTNIRARKDYVLSYDTRNRTAHWVFEHLTKDVLAKNEGVDRGKSDFIEDDSIHPYFRSKNSDYKGSGFDRGHLAPAGNHKMSQELCNETFYLSNMAPQVGVGFNRDKWEHLERYVRKLTKLYKNVYVCTGPLYLPKREIDGKSYVKYQVIGTNNVAVPTHFFKVIVGELENQDLELEAFVLPNEAIPDNVPLASFQVPPDAVERAAGLLFFDKISRDNLKKINGRPNKK